MKVGTRVTASPAHHPHLRGQVLEVVGVSKPSGQFIDVEDSTGKRHVLRRGEYGPAPAPRKPQTQELNMSTTPSERLDAAAKELQARTPGLVYSDAVKRASLNLSKTSAEWLEGKDGSSLSMPEEARPRAEELVRRGIPKDRAAKMAVSELLRSRAVSLNTAKAQEQCAEKFDSLVEQRVTATGESWKDAARAVAEAHPDWAAAR
jgi:hypothetical protein